MVVAGKDHECPLLYRLVEEFVQAHGRGVMKRLMVDRGFLDGAKIGRCKREWGIEVLIPVRRNMEIYQDVVVWLKPGVIFSALATSGLSLAADSGPSARADPEAGGGPAEDLGPQESPSPAPGPSGAFDPTGPVRVGCGQRIGDLFRLSHSPPRLN